MWPDWVSNPGPLTYESGALLTALRGPSNDDDDDDEISKMIFFHCKHGIKT